MAKGEKFNVAELSLLREFWGNISAHVIMTAEDGCFPTNAKQLLRRRHDLSGHARINSTSYVRLLWESSEENDKCTDAAIFEVKFGKEAEQAITDSRERTADTLFTDLESVAIALERH